MRTIVSSVLFATISLATISCKTRTEDPGYSVKDEGGMNEVSNERLLSEFSEITCNFPTDFAPDRKYVLTREAGKISGAIYFNDKVFPDDDNSLLAAVKDTSISFEGAILTFSEKTSQRFTKYEVKGTIDTSGEDSSTNIASHIDVIRLRDRKSSWRGFPKCVVTKYK